MVIFFGYFSEKVQCRSKNVAKRKAKRGDAGHQVKVEALFFPDRSLFSGIGLFQNVPGAVFGAFDFPDPENLLAGFLAFPFGQVPS